MMQLWIVRFRDGANVGKGFPADLTLMMLEGRAAKVPIIEFGNAGGIML